MNKPVAWIDEDGDVVFDVSWASQMQGKKPIPLYTHPAKELTDEEMVQAGYEIVDENPYDVTVRMEWAMWKAMLRKAPVKRLTDEVYFCSRCGKRLSDDIHTCTPPADILRKAQEK